MNPPECQNARTCATFLLATLPRNAVARTWIIWRWDGRRQSREFKSADSGCPTVTVAANAADGVGYWFSSIDRVGIESPRTGWLRTSDGAVRAVAQ